MRLLGETRSPVKACIKETHHEIHLDHAVTATQKTILKAFGMDANMIRYHAGEISRILREAK